MMEEPKNEDLTSNKGEEQGTGTEDAPNESSSGYSALFFSDDEDEDEGVETEEDGKKEGGEEDTQGKKTEGTTPTADKKEEDFISRTEYESYKREQTVDRFLSNPDNADYKEFEDKIRKVAAKPQAQGLTVDAIANMVVPPSHWIQKGASISQSADEEARASFTQGSGNRSKPEAKSGKDLPDPYSIKDPGEFQATAMRLARGKTD